MSWLDAARTALGTQPVKVGDLAATVSEPPAPRGPGDPFETADPAHEIEVIPEYRRVRRLLDAGAPLLFVTGGAGTGKSTLIHYLRSALHARIAVVAPTGVAALNAGGMTIHSLFYLPPKVIQPDDVRKVYDRRLYRKLELLIVDEVSMVRPDVLDGVDRFLRVNRDSEAPFGGVQVVVVGDLFQLPPVVQRDERRALRQLRYASDFFFSAHGLADSPLVPIFLNRVFRQSDPAFVSLLNRVREGKNLREAIDTLNARCRGLDVDERIRLVLTCTNRDADDRNREELDRLRAAPRTYTGNIDGEFRIDNTRLPAPMNLVLKRGAQVMFTKNDVNKRWVNGTIGTVIDLENDAVKIELERDSYRQTVEVARVTWEQYRYEYDEAEDRIVARVVGRYTQLPLMLAWAVTIHKAQGKTLDRAFVDLGHGAFAPGQVYVALSRVKSVEDLRLARPIRESEVRANPLVVRFYRQLKEMTQVNPGAPGG